MQRVSAMLRTIALGLVILGVLLAGCTDPAPTVQETGSIQTHLISCRSGGLP